MPDLKERESLLRIALWILCGFLLVIDRKTDNFGSLFDELACFALLLL